MGETYLFFLLKLLQIMQNSTKLSPTRLTCVIMIFLCANYGSTFAQDGQKAFNEGDKVISIGLSNGMIGALAGGYSNSLGSDIGFF